LKVAVGLKPVSYEAIDGDYIYTFKWLDHCDRWMVLRRKCDAVDIPPYKQALNYVDGVLKWEFILKEGSHQNRALYDDIHHAVAGVKSLLSSSK